MTAKFSFSYQTARRKQCIIARCKLGACTSLREPAKNVFCYDIVNSFYIGVMGRHIPAAILRDALALQAKAPQDEGRRLQKGLGCRAKLKSPHPEEPGPAGTRRL